LSGIRTTVADVGESTLEAQRPKQYFRAKNPEWVLNAKLAVSLPPSIPSAEAQAFCDDIQRELTKLENAAHDRIPKNKVLGAEQATQIPPESRITTREPAFQRNPTFALGRGATNELRLAMIAKRRAFHRAYDEALLKWRAGDRTVTFPAGTYAMRVGHHVNVAST